MTTKINTHFSDFFSISEKFLEKEGLLNISLINDLPLFIDPFLLFNSKKTEYQKLHDDIIRYLQFLKKKSGDSLSDGELRAWFTFPEIKQTWLGFTQNGNAGSGLGLNFAYALNKNLRKVFYDFGKEKITKSSHLEKLCLIDDGVGRDNISDFTTNLIQEYLLNHTQSFGKKYLPTSSRKRIHINKVRFNYSTETWESDYYDLPFFGGDYIILTPVDMLTRDEIWINHHDMISQFSQIRASVTDNQLRSEVNNYFTKILADKEKPTNSEVNNAILEIYRRFPKLLDYYIKDKEENGDQAEDLSKERVSETKQIFINNLRFLVEELRKYTGFYEIEEKTSADTKARILFLKDVIENKDGYRIFYYDDEPIRKETDLHILYRLTWFGSTADVNREVNNGRGPVDYKISKGSADSTLVEFKLATNAKLKQNLQNQVEIYKKASDSKIAYKVIFYFSEKELERVKEILKELKMEKDEYVILVDARKDNKISASKA